MLKVRFKKARMISLPGNDHVMLGVGKARLLKQSEGLVFKNGQPTHALHHPIDLDKQIFEIKTPDTTPRIPERRAEWDEEYYSRIRSAAYDDAIKARAELAELVAKIRTYLRSGTLEVIEDSEGLLARDDIELSEAEKAVAGLDKQQQPRRIPKPTEIVKAAQGNAK